MKLVRYKGVLTTYYTAALSTTQHPSSCTTHRHRHENIQICDYAVAGGCIVGVGWAYWFCYKLWYWFCFPTAFPPLVTTKPTTFPPFATAKPTTVSPLVIAS